MLLFAFERERERERDSERERERVISARNQADFALVEYTNTQLIINRKKIISTLFYSQSKLLRFFEQFDSYSHFPTGVTSGRSYTKQEKCGE